MTNQTDFVGPFRFADWPVSAVPAVAAGVYTIWEGGLLIYVGMSGRGHSQSSLRKAKTAGRRVGLWTRLNSHASGRRSGDQFCVYVADRLVLPHLTDLQVEEIAAGRLKFDGLIRERIRERMEFSFTITHDGQSAAALEAELRRGSLGAPPTLNPA